jgi:cysteine desulfurase
MEIYLDNAAATPIDPRVLRAVEHASREYGNPSSFNDAGRRARKMLDDSRRHVARFLGARPGEIVFCASGSEANTLALSGAGRILTQPTEHPSVLHSAGKRAHLVSVDEAGCVDPDGIARAIRAGTDIVSVMYANNETGTIQPIKKIGRVIREYRRMHHRPYPLFHVDACQATAWLPMNVQELGVDLLTINGAKIHGPHGTAALFIRRGVQLAPRVFGGDQEHGLRAGTEDVAGAAGLAAALRLIRKGDALRVGGLRRFLLDQLPVIIPGIRINGTIVGNALPNIVNVSIPDVSSEWLLLELDRRGIRAGSGSACTAHRVKPSHVLVAMDVPRRSLGGVLRISMSRFTTQKEVEAFLRKLPKAVVSCYNTPRSRYPSP